MLRASSYYNEIKFPVAYYDADDDFSAKYADKWDAIRVLKEGVTDNGEFLHIKSIEQMSPTEALIVLNEGKNREIRRLFNHIKNEVVSLVRIRIGGYTLPATLKSGMYKKLHDSDIARILRTSEGKKV